MWRILEWTDYVYVDRRKYVTFAVCSQPESRSDTGYICWSEYGTISILRIIPKFCSTQMFKSMSDLIHVKSWVHYCGAVEHWVHTVYTRILFSDFIPRSSSTGQSDYLLWWSSFFNFRLKSPLGSVPCHHQLVENNAPKRCLDYG